MSENLFTKIEEINKKTYSQDEIPKLDIISNKDEFDKLFEEYEFVVVDMTAKWCGPCQRIKPEIEMTSQQKVFIHIKFVMCDINDCDQDFEILEYVNVLPTFLLFKKGELLSVYEGANMSGLKNEILVYMTDQLD